MIKVILEERFTKRCNSGNVYHTVKITNVKNKKSFIVSTPSMGNVTGILRKSGIITDWKDAYECSSCTDSTRISSLPDSIYLDQCNFDNDWKKELNKIGFRLKGARSCK